jgi:hypothetical protein
MVETPPFKITKRGHRNGIRAKSQNTDLLRPHTAAGGANLAPYKTAETVGLFNLFANPLEVRRMQLSLLCFA